MTNLYIPICSFFVALLIFIIFFKKDRVESNETRIYSLMVVTSLVDTILMIVILLIGYKKMGNEYIAMILNKFDFIQYILWGWAFFLYIFHISFNKKDVYNKYNLITKITGAVNFIAIVLITILPITLRNESNIMYAYGPAVNLVYIICFIYFILITVSVILNIKNLLSKKYAPLFVLVALACVVFLVRQINPGLLIIPAVLTYINLIMYFTIENPDVKMINELNLAKDQAEKANLAKSDF